MSEETKKKTWIPPKLEVLEVKRTEAGSEIWEFIQVGDNAWKRQLSLES